MKNKFLEMLKRHEDLRLKPYKDTEGKLTIGYGRNLDDNGISKIEAEILFLHDVENAQIKLMCCKYSSVFKKLCKVRQEVLMNMTYNMGIGGVCTFKKMWGHLEKKEYFLAGSEMLDSKWAGQVGRRAIELAKIMRDGVYYKDQ